MSRETDLMHLATIASRYGITPTDLGLLLRASRTLHRWAELECGDGNAYQSWAIERDEATDKPYMVTYPYTGSSYRTPIRDREAGAKRTVDAVLARYPDLVALYQGDPRGAPLSIARKSDIVGLDPCNAASRGFAVAV